MGIVISGAAATVLVLSVLDRKMPMARECARVGSILAGMQSDLINLNGLGVPPRRWLRAIDPPGLWRPVPERKRDSEREYERTSRFKLKLQVQL